MLEHERRHTGASELVVKCPESPVEHVRRAVRRRGGSDRCGARALEAWQVDVSRFCDLGGQWLHPGKIGIPRAFLNLENAL